MSGLPPAGTRPIEGSDCPDAAEDASVLPSALIRAWLHEVRQPVNALNLAVYNLERDLADAAGESGQRLRRMRTQIAELARIARMLDVLASPESTETAVALGWFCRQQGLSLLPGSGKTGPSGGKVHRLALELLPLLKTRSEQLDLRVDIDAAEVRFHAGNSLCGDRLRAALANRRVCRLADAWSVRIEREGERCLVLRMDGEETGNDSA